MGQMHEEGVTLIELMVALAVTAILLTVGIPAFTDFIATNRMSAAVNDVVSSLQLARSEAIKRRALVTVCPSTDGASCTGGGLEQGWIVFADNNGNAQADAGEDVLSAHGPLAADIGGSMSWDNGGGGDPCYAAFDSKGFLRNLPLAPVGSLLNLQFCDSRGDHDTGGGIAAGRWLQLAVTGRPQVISNRALLQGAENPLGGC